MDKKYYCWDKTLSYDADVTMVIGARGIGKTFGLRKQCVLDNIKKGFRFIEVTRYKNELSVVSDGYFDRLSALDEFKNYMFKTDARYGYIADKVEENEKPIWKRICYFIALSDAQILKKRTFIKVKRIIFDEAILERRDRYHRYLSNEFGILANIVDTCSRERADNKSIRPRVYLLGNACDISNPYFAAYHVSSDLHYGYSWHKNKTFLLHYADPGDYAKDKAKNTVSGRMISGTESGDVALTNKFTNASSEFIAKKTKNAKFSIGIVCNGKKYGVWIDLKQGYYYITDKIPKNTGKPIYSLTREDASINYIAANRLSIVMRYVADMYYYNLLRYESLEIQNNFAEVLQMFGVR